MSPAREAALRLLRLMAAGTIIEETSMRQVLEALLLEEEKLLDQNRRLINTMLEQRKRREENLARSDELAVTGEIKP